MPYLPKAPIRNRARGEWRGPCLTFAEWLTVAVVPVWPEEWWPKAIAVPMAEAGLSVPLRVGARRVPTR